MKSGIAWKCLFACAPIAASFIAACGEDSTTPPPPPPPAVVEVRVLSELDSARIPNANVVLYRAETREAVGRGFTDANGSIQFTVTYGDYYTETSAQGFETTPPENISPIPFYLAPGITTVHGIALDPWSGTGDTGYVVGHVDPAIGNVLIVSERQPALEDYTTASGPDGVFVIYNLPVGDYAVNALKSGYQMSAEVGFPVAADAVNDTVRVPMALYSGSTLTGSVTFLASENSVVDITLLDRESGSVVPGLTVMSSASGLGYTVRAIPDGQYLAWASFRNDGYVVDPDWLFKNPGGLEIEFASATTLDLPFSVTGAISLVSPTNPASNTSPAMAGSAVPTFSWLAYPSTQEYFIEVRNFDGDLLWGGFEADGTSRHAYIPSSQRSVVYNFDAQPGAPALVPGEIYQWRLWADKGTQLDGKVEQLISASEDLRGLFVVPEPDPIEPPAR